ncbi:MAG TPA: deoxyribose-phosphate aldolase, partial [Dongiaceae bacterium]|nr:deoxyribose-phosphate aldolase [Dongiaceae bacterium]
MNLADRARQALSLLDLTSLNDNDTDAVVEKLCARAVTPHGKVAAVCVWPRFAALAKQRLGTSGVKVAAVANFPMGTADVTLAVRETKAIVAAGGDEVDVVFPYNSWLNGDHQIGGDLVKACKDACGGTAILKVILETGCLRSEGEIADASSMAIDAGADFIKTSTGKATISATPDSARIMLRAIKASGKKCGFKAAGGIMDARTAA